MIAVFATTAATTTAPANSHGALLLLALEGLENGIKNVIGDARGRQTVQALERGCQKAYARPLKASVKKRKTLTMPMNQQLYITGEIATSEFYKDNFLNKPWPSMCRLCSNRNRNRIIYQRNTYYLAIIKLWTMDGFFGPLNQRMRGVLTIDKNHAVCTEYVRVWENTLARSVWLLQHALKKLRNGQLNNRLRDRPYRAVTQETLYRGACYPVPKASSPSAGLEDRPWDAKPGETMVLKMFASTSLEEEVALRFALTRRTTWFTDGCIDIRAGVKGKPNAADKRVVLMKIKTPRAPKQKPIDIGALSRFQGDKAESEVLFLPGLVLKITNVTEPKIRDVYNKSELNPHSMDGLITQKSNATITIVEATAVRHGLPVKNWRFRKPS